MPMVPSDFGRCARRAEVWTGSATVAAGNMAWLSDCEVFRSAEWAAQQAGAGYVPRAVACRNWPIAAMVIVTHRYFPPVAGRARPAGFCVDCSRRNSRSMQVRHTYPPIRSLRSGVGLKSPHTAQCVSCRGYCTDSTSIPPPSLSLHTAFTSASPLVEAGSTAVNTLREFRRRTNLCSVSRTSWRISLGDFMIRFLSGWPCAIR